MVSKWRAYKALVGWVAIFVTTVVFFSGSAAFSGGVGFQHAFTGSVAVVSINHGHSEKNPSQECYPGLACSFAALCDQQNKEMMTQRPSDVKPVMMTLIMGRFLPGFDPPPPRRAT
jgi:hypothetical protein